MLGKGLAARWWPIRQCCAAGPAQGESCCVNLAPTHTVATQSDLGEDILQTFYR